MRLDIISILRVIVGLVFIVSGLAKGIDVEWFSGVVRGYKILPDSIVFPVSVLIAFFEFLLGFMLVFGLWVRLSSFVLIFMVLVFTIFSGFRYFAGDSGECGCFGRLVERGKGLGLIFENLVLFLLLLFINLKTKRRDERCA